MPTTVTVQFKSGNLVHQKAEGLHVDWTECHIYIPGKKDVKIQRRQQKTRISCKPCRKKAGYA